MKGQRHVNIPIFIPHLGCPNQCVFCNQRTISGVKEFDPALLTGIIEATLESIEKNADVEIAFFGGSFTGIDRNLMISLLKTAHSYIESGKVSGIRLSTRPDYINSEILDILKKYGVTVIELGLQSASDAVLSASKRGHTRIDELNACRLIKDYGFTLVGQMMIGLPLSDLESELETAKFIADVGADCARIYPTVVFKDTELCKMQSDGIYAPLELSDAVSRCAEVFAFFKEKGVKVIRIGLQSSENLTSTDTYFAGPNHSALGELVLSEYYYRKISKYLKENNIKDATQLTVRVALGELSKAIGQRRTNKNKISEQFNICKINFIEDENILPLDLVIDANRKEAVCI